MPIEYTRPLALCLTLALVSTALVTDSACSEGETPNSNSGEAEEDTGQKAPEATPTRTVATIVYQPPRRGSPRSRLGGGVRGARALPTPTALVPNHVALTTRAAPALYWHIDDTLPENVTVIFALLEPEAVNPLIEVSLLRPTAAGIQRVRLADHGVELAHNEEYEWVVALVPNPLERSHDIITGASIRRVEEPRLEGRSATASTFAELGLWYDALQSLNDAIERAPDDASLLAQRAQLLDQANLEVAIR